MVLASQMQIVVKTTGSRSQKGSNLVDVLEKIMDFSSLYLRVNLPIHMSNGLHGLIWRVALKFIDI